MDDLKLWLLDITRALALLTMFLSVIPAAILGNIHGAAVGLVAWPLIAALGLVVAVIADNAAQEWWKN